MKGNMRFYEELRMVPEGAKSEIVSGPLGGKGFSAISPMWRIRRLTEVFGPCGFGWYYLITDKRIEQGGNTAKVFVDIELYVKDPESGEMSFPIIGTGGSTFFNRDGISDEAFKMALTDAIGVAAKNLGLAADVYEEKDRLKNDPEGNMRFSVQKEKAPQRAVSKETVKEPKKEDKLSPTEEKKPEAKEIEKGEITTLQQALDFVIPFGTERGKTMKEAKENQRFWNFLSKMKSQGDKGKEDCLKAFEIIKKAEEGAKHE